MVMPNPEAATVVLLGRREKTRRSGVTNILNCIIASPEPKPRYMLCAADINFFGTNVLRNGYSRLWKPLSQLQLSPSKSVAYVLVAIGG